MVIKYLANMMRTVSKQALRGSFEYGFYGVTHFNVVESIVQTLNNNHPLVTKDLTCQKWKVTEKQQTSEDNKISFLLNAEMSFLENVAASRMPPNFQPRLLRMSWAVAAAPLFGATHQDRIRVSCKWDSLGEQNETPFTPLLVNHWHDLVFKSVLAAGGTTSNLAPSHGAPKSPFSRKQHKGQQEYWIYAPSSLSADDIWEAVESYAKRSSPFTTAGEGLQSFWWKSNAVLRDAVEGISSLVHSPTQLLLHDLHLSIAEDSPAFEHGIEASMSIRISADGDRMKVRILIETQGDATTQALVAAAVADIRAMIETECLVPQSGTVVDLVHWERPTANAFKSLREFFSSIDQKAPLQATEVLSGAPWWTDFHPLAYVGELRAYHAYGIRIVFRVLDEDDNPYGGDYIRVAAEWATFMKHTPVEITQAVSTIIEQAYEWLRRHGDASRASLRSGTSEWWLDPQVGSVLNRATEKKLKSVGAEETKSHSWPTPQDYDEAIQNADLTLWDSQLKEAEVELTALGLPRVRSGAFASVYRFRSANQSWAVRCFLHPVRDQEFRYTQISRFIQTDDLPYTISFEYEPQGILVNGFCYPVVKMQWVDAAPLHIYVEANIGNPVLLEKLRNDFKKMHADFRRAGIAHGDLQHGNVLVDRAGALFVVDYDNMFIPDFEGMPSNELGHPSYQHPQRGAEHFGPYMDNFSMWVIDTSLLCLSLEPVLWKRYSGGDDCLLLRRADYLNPRKSAVFDALITNKNSAIRERAKLLLQFLEQDILEVPYID